MDVHWGLKYVEVKWSVSLLRALCVFVSGTRWHFYSRGCAQVGDAFLSRLPRRASCFTGPEGKCVWSCFNCFNFPFSGRQYWDMPCAVFQILTTLRIFDEYFRTGRTRAERHQQLSFVCWGIAKKLLPFLSISYPNVQFEACHDGIVWCWVSWGLVMS